jgi:hypothetical protein
VALPEVRGETAQHTLYMLARMVVDAAGLVVLILLSFLHSAIVAAIVLLVHMLLEEEQAHFKLVETQRLRMREKVLTE